ncbi:MAG: HTTM domain-containing protein [Isosphaeraceae bacterium]
MNPLKAWNRFFFGPISARPLGAFRVVFGLIMLAYLALMIPQFEFYYTGAGLLQGTEAREAAGLLRFSPLQYVQSPAIAYAVLAATMAAAAGVMLGWRTRIMTVLLYLGMLSLYHRNVSSNGGPDAVPMITSFYLMFCPAGAAYSLDALRAARKRGTYAEPLIVPWAQRMLQMQLCLIYFQSSAIKCEGALWRNGTTVHYVLFNREFAWFNLEWLAQYPLLINVMSHGAILTQFALAFWLWFRPTRRWAILAGLGLHLGIRPMLNIPGFGEFMTAMYITFLAPDELDAVIRSLDPRVWFARLGLHSSLAALWRSSRPAPRPGWQQLEFPFEVTGQAGAGPAAAS